MTARRLVSWAPVPITVAAAVAWPSWLLLPVVVVVWAAAGWAEARLLTRSREAV